MVCHYFSTSGSIWTKKIWRKKVWPEKGSTFSAIRTFFRLNLFPRPFTKQDLLSFSTFPYLIENTEGKHFKEDPSSDRHRCFFPKNIGFSALVSIYIFYILIGILNIWSVVLWMYYGSSNTISWSLSMQNICYS